jgi:hypothetical protein
MPGAGARAVAGSVLCPHASVAAKAAATVLVIHVRNRPFLRVGDSMRRDAVNVGVQRGDCYDAGIS